MTTPNIPTYLTPVQVAKILQVSPATVRNMIKRGDLDAIQLKGGRGIFRVPLDAIHNLMGNDRPTFESRSAFNKL